MITVKVRTGEPIDKFLRVLKKKIDKEGIIKILKENRFHNKPSIQKKNKQKHALKYRKK